MHRVRIVMLIGLLLGALVYSIPSVRANVSADGTGKCANTNAKTTTCAFSLTTTQSNDIVVVFCAAYNSVLTAPTDTSSLSWTQRYNALVDATNLIHIGEWWALAASPLTGDSITCNFGGANAANDGMGLGITNANTTSPYDANSGLTSTGSCHTGCGTVPSVTVSTNNADDMILAFVSHYGTGSPVELAACCSTIGFQNNVGGGTFIDGYGGWYDTHLILSSVSVASSMSVANQWAMIGDAIQELPIVVTTTTTTTAAASQMNLFYVPVLGAFLFGSASVAVLALHERKRSVR